LNFAVGRFLEHLDNEHLDNARMKHSATTRIEDATKATIERLIDPAPGPKY